MSEKDLLAELERTARNEDALRHTLKAKLIRRAATELTRLREREKGLREALEWRPIETAPIDIEILIVYDSGEIELVTSDDNYCKWNAYDGLNEVANGISKPTHWMPLPALPALSNLPAGQG